MSANKKLGRDAALEMARAAERLIAAKGKKVTRVNISQDHPADDELEGLMLGPTGNMRAPTMRVGRIVFVGYNDQVFAEELG